jgi:hypothetical protein
MSNERKNKRVENCLLIATICIVAAILWVVLETSETAFAKKPGGGGEEAGPPCIIFDDVVGDSVQSDDGTPYCHDPKAKITVEFTQDGHLRLDTNSSNKTNVGRELYIDFGEPITVTSPRTGEWVTFTTTDEISTDCKPDASLSVGGWQDNFNFLTMSMDEERNDINMGINLMLHFPNDRQETPVFIKLWPIPLDNGRHCYDSDPVLVRCVGTDANGDANLWRIETQEFDHDGDGSLNEDPIDDIDNDEDGQIDEDPPGARACVSQYPFGLYEDDLSIGIRLLSFGMTVTSGVP